MLSASVINIESKISSIVNPHMVNLSFVYANEYKKNGKVFINCFLKYPGIRTACAFIIQAYKQNGAFRECQESAPDFTEYVSKLKLADHWRRVLAETLQIIYSILN